MTKTKSPRFRKKRQTHYTTLQVDRLLTFTIQKTEKETQDTERAVARKRIITTAVIATLVGAALGATAAVMLEATRVGILL